MGHGDVGFGVAGTWDSRTRGRGTRGMQEPITRSLHLPYKPYETSFARIFLFLETVGLLDWRALYAIQYNIIQYDTAQHNSTQNNTIQCSTQYAFLGI